MTTTLTKDAATTGRDLERQIVAGALGGIAGGMVFGMAMQMMGMIPKIAALVGHTGLASGWAVHLLISMVLGAGFGALAGRALTTWVRGLLLGLAYGMVWWVLGALLLMPARLGMPIFQFNTVAWQSLMGHMMFGAILGVVAVAVLRRGRVTSG